MKLADSRTYERRGCSRHECGDPGGCTQCDSQRLGGYGRPVEFHGSIAGDFAPLRIRDLSGIIQQGGTILKTARLPELSQPKEQERAVDNLKERDIAALVIIGGNGSLAGAHALAQHGLHVVGLGATIDDDVL